MGRYSRVVIWIAGLIFTPALLFAQFNNNTTSPYSRYGLGDLQPNSFGRTTAMGGASIAGRNSQQINMANPASYTAVDSLAFLFEFGVFGKFSNYSNDISSMNASDINFRYFALNFQFTNWLAASMGLLPFSDVGYNIEVNETVENTGNILYRYYGVGSVSRAYFGLSVDPVKNVSVGANLNYLFGSLNRNSEGYSTESSDFYNIQKYERIRMSDFGLDFGVQATFPLKAEEHITIGAVLEAKPEYTAFYSDLTQKTISATNASDVDTLNFQDEEKSSIILPLTYGLGVSYVKQNRLEINADYYHQNWANAKFFGSTNPVLTDLNKFALGAEWIPDKFSIGSYLNRIAYRAGLKYEKSYVQLNNQPINDFGISFGVGLPVYRSNSTINVSAEIGRRGTKENNLILENYAKLNLSVNLYDLWFIQRRFD
ncbi:MAG: hypothetical protein ACOCVA_02390 [Prolixibacteraceae bacterium]